MESQGGGKTSFAAAVAGHFELDIYTVSLSDENLNDSRLLDLFQGLRSRCLVLLEDIDCAGLGRKVVEDEPAIQQPARTGRAKKGNSKEQELEKRAKPIGVTLSGLLNAIDGASAPQNGHVLVMTTNHLDRLDAALIRPGRVDMVVEFEYASKEQIRDLFVKMYTPYRIDKAQKFDVTTLSDLADKFAGIIPAGVFSPAELQQHILLHRVRPQEAVKTAKELVERREETIANASGTDRAASGHDQKSYEDVAHKPSWLSSDPPPPQMENWEWEVATQ
jgi:chaperone BCS1